jgi:parallel beta-helix repeat protein
MNKTFLSCISGLLLAWCIFPFHVSGGIYVVSPDGDDAGSGSLEEPFRTIQKGMDAAQPGDTVFIRGGYYDYLATLRVNSSRKGTAESPFCLFAYPGERPVIDFYRQASGSQGFRLEGDYWHIRGLDIRNAGHNGMRISGSYNRVENCSFSGNDDTGLNITDAASHNEIINCDAFNNADPPHEDADGFGVKFEVGPGNRFYGCRAWNNSDDGWDLWRASQPVVIEHCLAFRNGYLANGQPGRGNGNGFKLGGDYVSTNHTVSHCIAFDNLKYGFHQNNNPGELVIYQSIGIGNVNRNYNFYLAEAGPVVMANNISVLPGSADRFTNCIEQTNSWNGFTVNTDDFLSTDRSLATAPRLPDGSLPPNLFLRLAAGSSLIDGGTDLGLPFNGAAPDLGPFETPGPAAVYTLSVSVSGNGQVWLFPGGGLYEDGREVLLVAIPEEDWLFDGWSGEVTGEEDSITVTMTRDLDLVAGFVHSGVEMPDSLRFEAEHMFLYAGYVFQRVSGASGGKLITAASPDYFSYATFPFPGKDSLYMARMGYLDQTGGASSYELYVNDVLIKSFTGDAAVSQNQYTVREILNLDLKQGDQIKIRSNRDGPEYGRVDYLELVASEYIVDGLPDEAGQNPVGFFRFYPNPVGEKAVVVFHTTHSTTVRLQVFDPVGRLVHEEDEEEYPPGIHRYVWETGALPQGLYFCRLSTPEKKHVLKIVKQ